MNAINKTAIGLIVVGAVLLAGPMFGFGSFSAERGTTIDVPSNQSNAYLGIDSESDIGTISGGDTPQRVATLFNNLNEDVDVIGFEIYNDSDALAVDSPNAGSTIASGASENVTIVCADSVSPGPRNIGIEVVEVDGTTASIRGASFNTTVEIRCKSGSGSGSGAVNFQASDVATTDTNQTFSFSGDGLSNKDEVYINVSGPQTNNGVDYTGATPAVDSGRGTVSYDGGDRIVYTAAGGESGTIKIRMEGIAVEGDDGVRYTVTYSEQRKNSNDRDDSDIFYVSN